MSDEWLKEAERLGDEAGAFGDWCNDNEEMILERYLESLTVEDIPDEYFQLQYEREVQE